ncbi:MAG: hypothetical protein Q8O86_01920 [Dehalococcoidia bacterium]|nr:hypothetical protein [Dehalococcoidia bacterium]
MFRLVGKPEQEVKTSQALSKRKEVAMRCVIEQEHTNEECLHALDEIGGQVPQLLGNCYIDCMAGEHRAYCVVDAGCESEVCQMVPPIVCETSCFNQEDKFTTKQTDCLYHC